nr:hypothetical protein [uncultured Undibacterium sp.]
MKLRTAFFITFGIFIAPILLCVLYVFLIRESIGLVVFIYSLVGAIAIGAVWGFSLSKRFGTELGVLGVIIAPAVWLVLINYFMAITFLFGIKDYNEM